MIASIRGTVASVAGDGPCSIHVAWRRDPREIYPFPLLPTIL